MATNQIRVNLAADTFPLLLDESGRSIIVQSRAEAAVTQTSPNSQRNQSSIPIPMYVANYLPTSMGYQSVTYNKDLVPTALPTRLNKNATIYELVSDDGIKSHLIGNTDGVYLRDGNNKRWKKINPSGRTISESNTVTTATVQGKTYICIQLIGVFLYDPQAVDLIPVELDGLVTSQLVGIVGVGSYLIAYDLNTIYWSSVLTPTDFVPDLITGAGSTKVSYVKSDIITCLSSKNGMVIYTTSGAVSAQLTGDMNNPLLYVELQGFPGIDSYFDLSIPKRNEDHYALTKTGIYRINLQNAVPVFPEVSQFIRGKAVQEYIHNQDISIAGELKLTYSDEVLDVKLRTLYNDYFLISYSTYRDLYHKHLLVYDAKLDRWGKLNISHIDILDYITLSEFFNIRHDELPQEHNSMLPPVKGNTPKNTPLKDREYSSFKAFRENDTDESAVLGLLSSFGEFITAHTSTRKIIDGEQVEYMDVETIPVMILGDYASSRKRHTFIDQITIDDLKEDSKVIMETRIEKNTPPIFTRFINIEGGDSSDYFENITGRIHRLHLIGQGSLSTIVVSSIQEGEV